ncbi:MAG: hypothetical protein E7310_06315 [Clostridiales bacterium]|nr:hypothetical protein [Clostridiales bacterium]
MFNRKKIEKLNKTIKTLGKQNKELIYDFILVLENLQEINNQKMQWKHKQLVINNSINLATENLYKKTVDIENLGASKSTFYGL